MIICGADNPLTNEGDFEEKVVISHTDIWKKYQNPFVQVATPVPSNIHLPATAMATNHR